MILGTVITASHWRQAKVLADSIRRKIPEAKFVICLVERIIPEWMKGEEEIWLAKDLRKAGDFDKRIFRYEPFPACCSVKPLFLDELMHRFPDENQYVYVDSDIQIYSPFKELETLLKKHPVVLTPHHLDPKAPPWRYDYSLLFGLYNAGLIALNHSEKARSFVDWWMKRTHRDTLFDWGNGLFAEQRWLSYAPIFFHAKPIKHPGYNVASWNLHERDVTRSNKGVWLVNDKTLRCFHFHNLQQLLKICKENLYKDNHALHHLVTSYAASIHKIKDGQHYSWSYGTFENGEIIRKKTRKIYANNIGYEKLPMNPFKLSNVSFEI